MSYLFGIFAANQCFNAMKKTYYFALTVCLIGMMTWGCEEDNTDNPETKPLHFEKKSYEVMLDFSYNISVENGSGNYELTVGDTAIISASYTDNSDSFVGVIPVRGKAKGTTSLIVKDKETLIADTLQIKVVDQYAACYIVISQHPALAQSRYLFLVDNEARDFYVFADDADELPAAPTPLLLGKGTYRYSTEEGTGEVPVIPYLHLTYAEDSEGDFAKEGTPVEHTFSMVDTGMGTLYYLAKLTGFPIEDLPLQISAGTKDNIQQFFLRLTDLETGIVVESRIDTRMNTMPEGFLD